MPFVLTDLRRCIARVHWRSGAQWARSITATLRGLALEIRLLDNDEATFRDALAEACGAAQAVRAAVAFVKGSGLAAAPELERAMTRGAEIRLLAGVDFQLTDLDALDRFDRPPSAARVYVTAQPSERSAFHPKLYYLESGDVATAIVGSSNLTGGGLVGNVEANIYVKGNREDHALAAIRGFHDRLWESPSAVPLTSDFRQTYHSLQDCRHAIELALRSDADYEKAHRALRSAVAEAILGYRGKSGRSWLLITSPENYIRCIDGRVWGDEDRGRIAQVRRGDVILFYVKSPAKYLAAMGFVTREPYTDSTIIWKDDERVYPHRFTFEVLLRPPWPVPLRPLISQLDLFDRRDDPHWGVRLRTSMTSLTGHDSEVLRKALADAQGAGLVA